MPISIIILKRMNLIEKKSQWKEPLKWIQILYISFGWNERHRNPFFGIHFQLYMQVHDVFYTFRQYPLKQTFQATYFCCSVAVQFFPFRFVCLRLLYAFALMITNNSILILIFSLSWSPIKLSVLFPRIERYIDFYFWNFFSFQTALFDEGLFCWKFKT